MGLFDFFRARRQRESAVRSLEITADPSTQIAPPADSFEAASTEATPGVDLAGLGQLGALIAHAAKEGNIQVHEGTPQEIDLRGTGVREEIMGILRQHGIDVQDGSGQQIDASQVPGMQQEILDALARQGVDLTPGDEKP